VGATLAKMAGAMLVGMFAVAAFNITDTYFVARLGTRQLAAMSFTFPVVMLIGGIAIGIGVGATAVISRIIGQGLPHQVRQLTTDALLLALAVVAVLVAIGLLTIRPLFGLLGATAETLPLVESYMRIWYVGMIFVVVPMVGNSAIRATGDMVWPSVIMVVDLGLNIVLDPPLIFGFGPIPAMGISGAAVATVLCRALALPASLYVLGRRKGMLTLEPPSLRRLRASWKRILHVGLPAAASHMLMPVSAGVLVRIVSWSGTAAVAAYGAGSRIERLVVMPLMALGVSMVPFVGQNRGAGTFGRIRQAHQAAWRFSVFWGLACALPLALFSGAASRIFSSDPAVCRYLSLLLCVAPLAYGLKGLSHLAGAGMNAIGRPYHAWAAMALRLFALALPMAAIGALVGGFVGLIVGVTVAEILAGLAATRWVLALYRRAAAGAASVTPHTPPLPETIDCS